ncbi:glucooligosaccharide oxidase [Mycena floridula]|nr:glucooligosaccharide oxidase [Mycena floridula]
MKLFALISLFAICVVATDLKRALSATGISVVFPGDVKYANASQSYNLRFAFAPAAIAYPTTAEDVSALVKVGVSHKVNVAARSGGVSSNVNQTFVDLELILVSYIANGLGGKNGSLVVDLSKMKNIAYNAETGHAFIETGNRLGDIALALNDYGRGLPHGRCTQVGIGGHSGYGGFGHTGRMWGLTLDTIQSVTMVLADGSIANVSETSRPDLFWAIRGSSPSFGIVTTIEFKTFKAPEETTIYLYQTELSVENATLVLSSWQDFADVIPLELGGEVVLMRGSSIGHVQVWWFGGYYGPIANFNATVSPFLSLFPEPPTPAFITSGDWLSGLNAISFGVGPLNTSTAPDPSSAFYAKSLMTPEETPMTQEAMSALLHYLGYDAYDSLDNWATEVELFGGNDSAINSVPLDATAFGHRNVKFNIQFYAASSAVAIDLADFGLLDGMVGSLVSNMPADWNIGTYMNYIDNRLDDWQKLYYGPHYQRLTALKKVYDPLDVFHFPKAV